MPPYLILFSTGALPSWFFSVPWERSIEMTLNASVALALLLWTITFFYRARLQNRLPQDFQRFSNTSFPIDEARRVLRAADFINEFGAQNNGAQIVHVGNFVMHASSLYAGEVKTTVSTSGRPDLVVTSMPFPLDINLSGLSQKDDVLPKKRKRKEDRWLFPHIINLIFQGPPADRAWTPIVIRGARILRVIIEDDFRDMVVFEDCWIASLEIKKRAAENAIQLRLSECYIGGLTLNEHACSTLSIKGGAITGIYCSSLVEKSPIRDALTIDSSAMLSPDSLAPESTVAQYRNLAGHIRNKSDLFSQQNINSVIYRLERAREKGFMRFVNTGYQVFSRYNTRPGRPLLWILFTIVFSVFVVYNLDAAALPKQCSFLVTGNPTWLDELCTQTSSGKLARSITLVFNNFINPLSALSDTSLMRAKYLALQFVLIFSGLLNLIWATLAIFSVKTRFSIKGASQ
jgi:hypothetical protein